MISSKPIWERLKNMLCPKCNSALNDYGAFYSCTVKGQPSKCNFRILKKRFDEIVADLYKPKRYQQGGYQSEEESLAALNNMGHEPVGDDYAGNLIEY